ncbi:hypothetical protein [Embleya sp. NBC_00896]|uniref:hypothetical protein n=1 Tax=Embleya sp. NBC_00896 TaxID=2975961 RepID=UPI002F913E6A|nr:hypothetical protein OG928_34665 [Embleya sp. NBC_00896]
MQFSTTRRIAAITAVGGAMVAAQLGLASGASAAGEIKVTAPATIKAGTTDKVAFTTKTDAPVTIVFAPSADAEGWHARANREIEQARVRGKG